MKRLKFRLHFNRVNMQRGNPRIWTVHTSLACYQVERVICQVPLETVYKQGGGQPRAYLSGRVSIKIKGNTAFLVP